MENDTPNLIRCDAHTHTTFLSTNRSPDILGQSQDVLDSERIFQYSILNSTFNEMNTATGATIHLVIVNVADHFSTIEASA